MFGKSLRPILTGQQTGFSDRKTILTASHQFQDSRAVCDGTYYYIQNIRKTAGASVDSVGSLKKALNTDQYKGGSPWQNRTYDATLAATGSPQRELLRQLVEGDVPDEELYDLSTDPWMTNNLMNDPEKAPLLKTLRAELDAWRDRTNDCDDSPAELKRREQRLAE
jgi:hypothetical protein